MLNRRKGSCLNIVGKVEARAGGAGQLKQYVESISQACGADIVFFCAPIQKNSWLLFGGFDAALVNVGEKPGEMKLFWRELTGAHSDWLFQLLLALKTSDSGVVFNNELSTELWPGAVASIPVPYLENRINTIARLTFPTFREGLFWLAGSRQDSDRPSCAAAAMREYVPPIGSDIERVLEDIKFDSIIDTLLTVIDSFKDGVIIIDENARVQYLSEKARLILSESHAVSASSGKLSFVSREMQKEFDSCLSRLFARANQSYGFNETLTLKNGGASILNLIVTAPPNMKSTLLASQQELALVVVSDPETKDFSMLPLSILGTAYGFTRTELQLTQHLLRGESKKDIAAAMNISEGTVRWHFKNLLAKTGTNREGQMLLKILKTLPLNSTTPYL